MYLELQTDKQTTQGDRRMDRQTERHSHIIKANFQLKNFRDSEITRKKKEKHRKGKGKGEKVKKSKVKKKHSRKDKKRTDQKTQEK